MMGYIILSFLYGPKCRFKDKVDESRILAHKVSEIRASVLGYAMVRPAVENNS